MGVGRGVDVGKRMSVGGGLVFGVGTGIGAMVVRGVAVGMSAERDSGGIADEDNRDATTDRTGIATATITQNARAGNRLCEGGGPGLLERARPLWV